MCSNSIYSADSLGGGDLSVRWDEPPAADHIAQFYEDEDQFLRALTCFIATGLRLGESVIVVATARHEAAVRLELMLSGVDLDSAAAEDRYIPLNAEVALATFMANGWPDDRRFTRLVELLVSRARKEGRRVRAFGEMAALLWADGAAEAAVRLEWLWNEFSKRHPLPVFCAYSKAGLAETPRGPVEEICAAHSRLILEEPDAAEWIRESAA
jgi:hypothetical protein